MSAEQKKEKAEKWDSQIYESRFSYSESFSKLSEFSGKFHTVMVDLES